MGPIAADDRIRISGAREHNLKDISLELPRDALIVITGLSGSGKSSLAFDTIYAEGQRRYVESLSAYARQFLGQMDKPDVDSIEGLSPAISIEQKSTSHNPRSTVGTVTEIHDYLRLLYARAGTPYCPQHGLALEAQTVAEMVDQVAALPEDSRVMILAPVIAGRKGEQADLLEELRAQGFTRVRIDGDLSRVDGIAAGMSAGEMLIFGNVGARLGASMSGGWVDVRGDTGHDRISATLMTDAPAPAGVVPGLPPVVSRIVHHCLEKRPEERYQSARDLAFKLETLGDYTSVTRALKAEPAPALRRRLLWYTAAAVIALAAFAAVFFVGQRMAGGTGPVYQRITFQHGTVLLEQQHSEGVPVLRFGVDNGARVTLLPAGLWPPNLHETLRRKPILPLHLPPVVSRIGPPISHRFRRQFLSTTPPLVEKKASQCPPPTPNYSPPPFRI